jgi:Family of unknown function (DUF5689)
MSSLAFTACMEEDPNPAEGQLSPYITFEDVKALYKGQEVALEPKVLTEATSITGIVISDVGGRNTAKGNIVLQQRKRGRIAGISLSFGESAAIPYVPGDSIVVKVSRGTLTRVQGRMTITGLDLSDVRKVAGGKVVKPRTVALGELNKNFNAYEGTLVQVIGADINPTPVPGETYSGDKRLKDGSADTVVVKLHTESTASFATNRVPANATFTGIALYANGSGTTTDGAQKSVWMRTQADAENASGPLYTGFPEDFESPDASVKTGYAAANVALRTGEWRFDEALFGTTAGRDRFNPTGKQAVRLQQNLSKPAYLQMNFDLPNGASKVTLSYGAYYTDAKSSWKLEYSTDGGKTWTQTGAVITDAPAGSATATFLMDIKVPVRFRVNKLGLGTTNNTTILNGRLSIDDFAVYAN